MHSMVPLHDLNQSSEQFSYKLDQGIIPLLIYPLCLPLIHVNFILFFFPVDLLIVLTIHPCSFFFFFLQFLCSPSGGVGPHTYTRLPITYTAGLAHHFLACT